VKVGETAHVVLYSWPESQKCMDCKNSEFVMSDTLVNSNYLCMANCPANDGSHCPEFDEKQQD
jgi:hypothetical protein